MFPPWASVSFVTFRDINYSMYIPFIICVHMGARVYTHTIIYTYVYTHSFICVCVYM